MCVSRYESIVLRHPSICSRRQAWKYERDRVSPTRRGRPTSGPEGSQRSVEWFQIRISHAPQQMKLSSSNNPPYPPKHSIAKAAKIIHGTLDVTEWLVVDVAFDVASGTVMVTVTVIG